MWKNKIPESEIYFPFSGKSRPENGHFWKIKNIKLIEMGKSSLA